METWLDVESKGLVWRVSSEGRVRTPAHTTTYTRVRNGKEQKFTSSFKERDLTPVKTATGYLEVYATKNGRRTHHLLHRLVGMAFVPGYSPELTINHINGDKTDNAPSNLEWVSLARNTQHQWETGLVDLRGEKQPQAKLTSKRVLYIRKLLRQGIPAHALAVVAGVSTSTIAFIRDGKRWASVVDAPDETSFTGPSG